MINNKSITKKKFDLEDQTAEYAERVLLFLKTLPVNLYNESIIRQLVKSCTSIGANYCEADGAESKKDFQHKIGICKKESKETKYWIRMLSLLHPEKKEELRILWKEAQELTLIFSKIIQRSKIKREIGHV